jgi:hypothetical protein
VTSYRYMETGHAGTVMVGENAVPVAPGDFIDLSANDVAEEHNAWLIEEELLIDVSDIVADEEGKPGKPSVTATADKEVKK